MVKYALLAASLVGLAACEGTDGQRAAAGAFTGATIAAVFDGNIATGAAAGAAVGALCDDAGACTNR